MMTIVTRWTVINRMLGALAVACCISSTALYAADTLYVSSNATTGGDGQSWATAFATVDAAIAAWQDSTEVWVARGTYAPPSQGYNFPNGLRMYGGFNGNEVTREERDWYRRPTVITAPDAETLVRMNQCDSSSRLDGFVLQGATDHALLITGGCPRIVNCRFRNNSGTTGAAILAEGTSRVRIEYCIFGANQSQDAGGAVTIRQSVADSVGFGAFIAQCQFYNNASLNSIGGALYIESSPTMPQISSCVFNGNSALDGGAVATLNAYLYITNATFYNNTATTTIDSVAYTLLLHGGAIQNSICWNGNLPATAVHVRNRKTDDASDTATIASTANLIEADFTYGFWQVNPNFEDESNVAGADGFFGTDDDGLRLSKLSIARDAGYVDRFVNHRQTDAIGNPRLVGRKLDLGAYESQRPGRLTPPEMVEELKTGRYSFFYRHSKTDWGQKDPGPSPECFPGRNLIYEGREMMREVGKAQRLLGIPIGPVESSPVCRCWETALLMCGRYEKVDIWGSGGNAATFASRDSALSTLPTGGNRVITSHDAVANLVFNAAGDGTVLTTAELMEGDNLFVLAQTDTFEVVAHWCADTWERYRVRFPDPSTSVQEFTDGQGALVCFPNPTSDNLTVQVGGREQVRIVNLLGNTLWSGVVDDAHVFDTRAWPAGMVVVVTDHATRPVLLSR